MKLNKKGFTMVEILASIVILGILMGIAIASVSYVLSNSKEKYYSNLDDQLVLAAKSFYGSHKILLPQSIGQIRQVTLETLIKNNYIKRGDVVDYSKAECDTNTSYVKVIKSSEDEYIYSVYLKCPTYSVDDDEKISDVNVSVSIPNVDDISDSKAIINMSVDEDVNRIGSYQYIIYKNDQVVYSSNNISGDNQSRIKKTVKLNKYVSGVIKVVATVYDIYGNFKSASSSSSIYEEGLPECGSQSPSLDIKDDSAWINAYSTVIDRKITQKCIDSNSQCLFPSFSKTFTSDAGESYITILGKNSEEVNCPVTVMIDRTKPICDTKIESTTWTSGNRTVSVRCSDVTSGCKQSSYSETFDNTNSKNKVIKKESIIISDKAGNTNLCPVNVYVDKQAPTCKVSGGSTSWVKGSRTVTVTCSDAGGSGCKVSSFEDTVSETTKTKTYTVEDNVGNQGTCTANIYVDNTAPTSPIRGSIGEVSGSDVNANIATEASGSKDNHSGVKQYLYMVTNSPDKPSNTNPGFTNSKAFIRSCGTSYYAWAVAEDKVGNRSEVVSLGNTKDEKDEYTEWSSCSKLCGGGKQSRSNTCALITENLVQDCNTQECCSESNPLGCAKYHTCRIGNTAIYDRTIMGSSTVYGTLTEKQEIYKIADVNGFWYVYVPAGGKFNNVWWNHDGAGSALDYGYIDAACIEPIGVLCENSQCHDPT